jgi:hypothetical protein
VATIAVSGALAQRPGRPGHAWVFLSYLLGFLRLGHRVLFIDRLDERVLGGGLDRPADAACSEQAHWLKETMARSGLEHRYSALLGSGRTLGLSRSRLLEELRRSAFLLNINGYLDDEELLAAAPRRVYLDIDPGFAQMWEEQGLADAFAGHDDFVTVATNLGAADCRIPTCGRRWIRTLPPVVLDLWPAAPAVAGGAFTSVGSWRGPFGPIEHGGEAYGLRAHEFRRFVELPARVASPFALALDIDAADWRDAEALRAARWRVIDPLTELSGFTEYERYVRTSMAEISIAKGMYVRTRGGWFSDRSASYLASGRPVIAQDTGFGETLPTGRGLLRFDDLDEAAQAAEEVRANLPEHAASARAIAEEHLDSDVVLGGLLARLGVA